MGNKTLCRPIRSVIILVIKQIGLQLCSRLILFITRMITHRIGLHSVLLPLLIRLNVQHQRYASTCNNQSLGSVGDIKAKALAPAMRFAFY